MDWTVRRESFRHCLDGTRCLHPASVFDPLSARIADELGFEVGMFAGSVASLTVLGDPDLILLTLSEFAEQAYRINRAGRLPLMVDADHGYGNAFNVRRTVEELETAGVSGLSIEDTALPEAFGAQGKASLISVEEGIGKMKAAVSGRQDSKLVIAARTSAVAMTGVADAIERVRAYQETGVDAIFLVGVKKKSELDAIAEVARLPLILGGAGPELQSLDLLAERGVRIALQGHQPIMASIEATYRTMAALRSGTKPGDLKGLPDRQLVAKLTRSDAFNAWRDELLNAD
jgi:carboxyvinyl-carboxyphosphonate phosphorylmutase